MPKSIEDLYRATKEKVQTEQPKKTDNGVRYEKPTPPKEERWYEKHWGIWLLLILCFPLGVILLMSSPKYSGGSKVGIALAGVCVIFFVLTNQHEHKEHTTYRQETYRAQSTAVEEKIIYASAQKSCFCVVNAADLDGFINAAKRKDVAYLEKMLIDGRAFVVRRNTRVLCSDSGIYKGIVFVTFLEGEFEGMRAYTVEKRVR